MTSSFVNLFFLFIYLKLSLLLTDDLADDLEDVDFEEAGNADDDDDDDEGWVTEDEMEAEAEQDDSELTFSKHTSSVLPLFILFLSDIFESVIV